jgi:hypothetical protein
MKNARQVEVKISRLTLYIVIALTAVVIAYYILVREPLPDWPINLIHLLTRH